MLFRTRIQSTPTDRLYKRQKSFLLSLILILSIGTGLSLFFSWQNTQEIYEYKPGKTTYQYTAEPSVWKQLDYAVFLTLNGTMKDSPVMQTLWGITNYRAFDLIPALWMLSIYLIYYFRCKTREQRIGLIQYGFFMLFALLVAMLASRLVVDFYRFSPTLVDDLRPQAFLLSQIPDFFLDIEKIKDTTNKSFPGDHASVLLLLGFFMIFRLPWAYAGAVLLGMIIFSIPRLAGGGHWLSDIVAGGLALSLVFVPVFLYPPVREFIIAKFYSLARKMYYRLPEFLQASG